MPLNSTRSGVSGSRHGFSGRVGSRSVSLYAWSGNCAARYTITPDSETGSKHNKMNEVGLFHTNLPTPDFERKVSGGRREVLTDFLGSRDFGFSRGHESTSSVSPRFGEDGRKPRLSIPVGNLRESAVLFAAQWWKGQQMSHEQCWLDQLFIDAHKTFWSLPIIKKQDETCVPASRPPLPVSTRHRPAAG